MRLSALVRKTTLENLRDWKILVMTLTFAPFFTVLMYFYFESASESPYRVVVVNEDEGAIAADGSAFYGGRELVAALAAASQGEGSRVLRVVVEDDVETAIDRLESGSIELVVVVPDRFSSTIAAYRDGGEPAAAIVTTYGDPKNFRYLMAAAWSDAITYTYAAEVADLVGPVAVEMQSIGTEESPSQFDLYVPGLLALAIIMLMFTAAATVIKEKDRGTLVRLRISNMSTSEWFVAVTLVQLVLGVLAVALTLLTTMLFGYQPDASLAALAVVTALSSIAIVGISFLVAAWLRTIFDLMTIGCFPFFILMFFSGAMFPLPPVRVFELAGKSVNINDVLPVTHSIAAFDAILNRGAGLGDILFELAAIAVLSVGFLTAGTWWFTKRHMSAGRV